MRVRKLHSWEVCEQEAIHLQGRLRSLVQIQGLRTAPRLMAGADVAYHPEQDVACAAVAVLEIQSRAILEEQRSWGSVRFPYIPGLLSFREGPLLIEAFHRLRLRPDVILFDGHGVAHPRRFGLACHMGLLLDIPSIGCAKTPLVGHYNKAALGEAPGSCAPIVADGETRGMAVRTRRSVKPVFVSSGHRADLAGAVRIVLESTLGYRIPEPLRRAHQAAERFAHVEEAKAS